MSCLLSFRLIFAIIGWRIAGGRGLILGFLLGWLFDSIYRRPTIHFTFQHGTDDFSGYQKEERQWQPYVDVTLQEAYRTLGIRETATDEEVRSCRSTRRSCQRRGRKEVSRGDRSPRHNFSRSRFVIYVYNVCKRAILGHQASFFPTFFEKSEKKK